MAPDLNSLPPSRSSTSSPLHARNVPSSTMDGHNNNNGAAQTVSSRSPSTAPVNLADSSHRSPLSSHRGSPRSQRPSISESRRRSGIGLHPSLNDPPSSDYREHRSASSISNYFRNASPSSLGGSPIIGTGDPHHQRAPSLGELHQELEQEQEAQVNRLLLMIRQQQSQLQQLQQQQLQQQGQTSGAGAAVVDDTTTPGSERSQSLPSVPPLPAPGSRSMQIPFSHQTRRGSRTSEAASPSLNNSFSQPASAVDPAYSSFSSDWSVVAGNEPAVPAARRSSRDEGAFYQAEAAMLTRENQMLRMRIRELERQLAALSSASNELNEAGESGGSATATDNAGTSTEAVEKT